ncbi:MAG: hypothetical protein COB66_03585 [Coxiella sp. (in: Bacteria)]|nr:MAG: hypothetical protein COB66_03585 [Coxiella sp. (in: g-proteobacteria)]
MNYYLQLLQSELLQAFDKNGISSQNIDISNFNQETLLQCLELAEHRLLALSNVRLLQQFPSYFRSHRQTGLTKEGWIKVLDSKNTAFRLFAEYEGGAYQDFMRMVLAYLDPMSIYYLLDALTANLAKGEANVKFYEIEGFQAVLDKKFPSTLAVGCAASFAIADKKLYHWGAIFEHKSMAASLYGV